MTRPGIEPRSPRPLTKQRFPFILDKLPKALRVDTSVNKSSLIV